LYRTGAVAALLCTALALASCGGGGAGSGGATTTAAGSTVRAKEKRAIIVRPEKVEPQHSKVRLTAACEARLEEFLGRMDDLRQSLLAGLSYDEYVVRVRAIRDAYEAVPIDKLGATCVTGPASEAEAAFNQYLRAANSWGECASTAGCAASEVEGRLQNRWRIAAKSLEAAERKG
jgi:hypothetical protein